jgi:hypothetical protein
MRSASPVAVYVRSDGELKKIQPRELIHIPVAQSTSTEPVQPPRLDGDGVGSLSGLQVNVVRADFGKFLRQHRQEWLVCACFVRFRKQIGRVLNRKCRQVTQRLGRSDLFKDRLCAPTECGAAVPPRPLRECQSSARRPAGAHSAHCICATPSKRMNAPIASQVSFGALRAIAI